MAVSRSGTHFAVSGAQNKRNISIHPYLSARDGVFPSTDSTLTFKECVRNLQVGTDCPIKGNAAAASALRPLRDIGYHGLSGTIRVARLSCKNSSHRGRWRGPSTLGYRNYEDYVPRSEVSRMVSCDMECSNHYADKHALKKPTTVVESFFASELTLPWISVPSMPLRVPFSTLSPRATAVSMTKVRVAQRETY